VELLGILIAVEMVPDVFRTIGNVTGDLAVTTLAQRRDAAATADQPVAGSPRT
jgi:Na+/H+-dicarboxylate symporter